MVNLLRNGNFSQSTGFGATSSEGPGWDTDYLVPSGGQLFSGAGAGAARYCLFTTNAAQVCNGAGATIAARDGRSFACNVGGVGDVIRWTGINLINGARYRISADAAIVIPPYDVGLAIDGAIILPMPSPGATGQWFTTSAEFTFTGATGPHTVSLRTNSGASGGNDHAFDNFILERVDNIPLDGCCMYVPTCYRNVTPCDVNPVQGPATSATVLAFDSATLTRTDPRSMRTGGGACGSVNISNQQAANLMIDGNLNGITSNAVFPGPQAPDTNDTPTPAEFRLNFAVSRNGVTGFRVYHGYGTVLNDTDGIRQGRVRAYNVANALLDTVTWNGVNNGAAQDVLFTSPLNNVAYILFDQIIRWPNQNQGCAGIRELQALRAAYERHLTWQCGGVVYDGLILGTQAGINVSGGNLTQTNGPHTIAFSSNNGERFTGEIITNAPARFSSLTFDQDSGPITITGNATSTFAVRFYPEQDIRSAYGDLGTAPPTYRDVATNDVLDTNGVEFVSCPRRDQ